MGVCVGVCMGVCVCVLWLPVADGCNFPTSISFPGLAMNKLCELFAQGPGAHPLGWCGGVATPTHTYNKCKKSRASPAAQNKVTSTVADGADRTKDKSEN